MHINYKMVSLVVIALVALSVVAGVISVVPQAEAAKKTKVAITINTGDNSLTGTVANNAKLKLQVTAAPVTFTATEAGSWGVVPPSGLGSKSQPKLSQTLNSLRSGVYTIDFTKVGATKPSWSATITVPFSVSISTNDNPTPAAVAKGSNLDLPVTAAPVTFTATEAGSWGVTDPSGLSSKSLPKTSITFASLRSGVYTVDFTKEGASTSCWSATITVPFSVSISTSDGSVTGKVASGSNVDLLGTGRTVSFTATESGRWQVSTPTIGMIHDGESVSFGTLDVGVYTADFTKQGSSQPDWSATVTVAAA